MAVLWTYGIESRSRRIYDINDNNGIDYIDCKISALGNKLAYVSVPNSL